MKNDKQDIPALRAARDEALATLAAAVARRDEAIQASTAAQEEAANLSREIGSAKTEGALRAVVAQIAAVEADDAAHAAERAAGAACDALEVAEGDELAIACDAGSIRADITSDFAAIVELKRQIAAIEQRVANRGAAAVPAWTALRERRTAAGHPAPMRPPAGTDMAGARLPLDVFLRALDAHIASRRAPSPTPTADLRVKEVQLRATLERARQKSEADAARRAEEEHAQAEARQIEARERLAAIEGGKHDAAAERAADQRLADAHRAREAR